jgi:hypothetical protein
LSQLAVDPLGTGVATIAHAEPFHCAASGLSPVEPLFPTAQHVVVDAGHDTLSSVFVADIVGMATAVQLVPFHRSASTARFVDGT